ncbi:MAG TPA: OsmC family protein [Thermoanaerobaculia bacterium]|nr:OsmC family protein [Thermoanaerobaculia bacterium]
MSGPTEVRLRWDGGERFTATAGDVATVVDGSSPDHLSPMQALALGVAACMSIDVVAILEKGRQPLEAMEVELTGERAAAPPRRFVSIRIHYRIRGAVDPARVERAIALSRDTYCSAWQSMRTDIELQTTFETV